MNISEEMLIVQCSLFNCHLTKGLMGMIRRIFCLLYLLLLFPPDSLLAQRGSLASQPGTHGVWVPPNAGDERLVEPDSTIPAAVNPFAIETDPLQRTPRAAGPAPVTAFKKLSISEVPFQPWARALYTYRQTNQWEPHTRCKPSGGPRQFMTPYGVEFIEAAEIGRTYIVDIGGPHTMRIIYMNSRHPDDLSPSFLGHSVGQWQGNTLVVDTIGFNEGFWIDRFGLPTTQQLHLIERFTRVDENNLKYEFTVDDPGAYTTEWTSGLILRWSPGQELFEYVCQDNNVAPQLMFGASESTTVHRDIVP